MLLFYQAVQMTIWEPVQGPRIDKDIKDTHIVGIFNNMGIFNVKQLK